jgi:hypothetical protein
MAEVAYRARLFQGYTSSWYMEKAEEETTTVSDEPQGTSVDEDTK